MRSPLILGNELTKTDKQTLKLITNPFLMDMHENSRHAHQVIRTNVGKNEIVLWTAARAGGGQYILIFNIEGPEINLGIGLDEFELEGEYEAYDLFLQRKYTIKDKISAHLEKHGVLAYLLETT